MIRVICHVRAYSGVMNSDASEKPNGSIEVDDEKKAQAESLPDGSQSDGTAESDNDTASGGPVDLVAPTVPVPGGHEAFQMAASGMSFSARYRSNSAPDHLFGEDRRIRHIRASQTNSCLLGKSLLHLKHPLEDETAHPRLPNIAVCASSSNSSYRVSASLTMLSAAS